VAVFFTSDHHFDHANIIKFCNRPHESVYDMNEDLVRKWNERVDEKDTVYHLGDVCLNNGGLRFVNRLNGIKYLIAGNHDRVFPKHKKYMKEMKRYLNAGFDQVFFAPQEFMFGRTKAILWHLPYPFKPDPANVNFSYDDRYNEWRIKDEGQWLVHGHTHGKWKKRKRMIDIGVDAWGGYPVSEAEVSELMSALLVNVDVG
jgi:calcineurin-like phosphoesterase family protein